MTKKYSDQIVLQICELYIEGKTIRQISARMGCSYGGVRRTLVRKEIPLWPRGGSVEGRRGRSGPPKRVVSE